jgi:hypothetical protein
MPGSVGLCPGAHTEEFYVPDVPDGYPCPSCEQTMARYVPTVDQGAVKHLQRLVDWGHGSDAPDDAKRDWDEARQFLERMSDMPT